MNEDNVMPSTEESDRVWEELDKIKECIELSQKTTVNNPALIRLSE